MTPRNTTRHGFTKVCSVILDFAAYFKEIGKLIPECICKGYGPRKGQKQPDNRKKLDSHYLVSNTQYKSTVIKTLWYWNKDRQTDGVRTDKMMEKNRGQVIVNKVAALSVIAKECKPPKCPPTDK